MPLLLFCLEVVSDSLRPLELQHARLPCPSLSPRVCSNSCPLSQWCHPTISSSVIPFSSCLQSFLLAHPLKISLLCPLLPCQQRPHVLAHLLSSSSNKGSCSMALTSLLTSAPKPTPAGLAHLSKATLVVRSPVARAFTSGGDPSAAFDRWDPSFLRDVIFPLASGQHTSLVSSCLNGYSFCLCGWVPDH